MAEKSQNAQKSSQDKDRHGLDSVDLTKELQGIADFIIRLKSEIRNLGVHELKTSKIPSAGHELKAIVCSTEEATSRIMENAEALLDEETTDLDHYRTQVNDRMMDIIEACSFQDLTGQRVAKVVEALESIECRVSRFAQAVHVNEDLNYKKTEFEIGKEKRREELLVNGPSSNGLDQNSVDSLFD